MTSRTIIGRRSKFVGYLDGLINQIADFSEGKATGGKPFWLDRGLVHIQLRHGAGIFTLPDGGAVITASSFEDAIESLDQLKIICSAGGLDDALANATKSRLKPLY